MAELTPEEVAAKFVKSYYFHICQSPKYVDKFYEDSSIVSRRGTDGVMKNWTTLEDIHDHVLSSHNYKDCIIFFTDAQSCIGNGVFVFVLGCITTKDESIRKFTQSFVLAPMEKPNAFFIYNDVLMFLDEEKPSKTSINVNPMADADPETEAEPESDVIPTKVALEKSFLTVVNALSSNNAPFKSPKMKKSTSIEMKKHKMQTSVVEKKSIFVANLSVEVKANELYEAFKKFGTIKLDGVKIKKDANNRRFAFIEFESSFSAQSAIQASSIEIRSQKLHIKEKTRNASKGKQVFCHIEGT